MPKLLIINETLNGSHGKICLKIASEYERRGYDVRIAYGRNDFVPFGSEKYAIRIGTHKDVIWHALYTRMTDKTGFASKRATRKFISWLDEYRPDEIWIHNIHGYYVNIKMLFNWIKKNNDYLTVKWTLHDCWSFTGHCSHFSFARCEKWKTGCDRCPQRMMYPKSFVDRSRRNYTQKKEIFCGIKNMQIVTPSDWLTNLVKQSFLKNYDVVTIHNEIDSSVFHRMESDFREKHRLAGKFVILAVAGVWNERKGLYDLVKISKLLGNNYKLVVVGLNEKQERLFPNNVISIRRTENQSELAKIYSASDIFLNPTYEDTFPTVNLESEACGTPVITYKTGGAPETVSNEESTVVEQGSIDGILSILQRKAIK